MSAERITAIRQRLAAAAGHTPRCSMGMEMASVPCRCGHVEAIANAPSDIEWLLDEVERLTALCTELRYRLSAHLENEPPGFYGRAAARLLSERDKARAHVELKEKQFADVVERMRRVEHHNRKLEELLVKVSRVATGPDQKDLAEHLARAVAEFLSR